MSVHTPDVINVLIAGEHGRMAYALEAVVGRASGEGVRCLGRLDRVLTRRALIEDADVVLDFTAPEFTDRLVAACRESGTGMVIGTTGHSAEQTDEIRLAAEEIAICQSANFSIGVNVLSLLAEEAARLLPESFDIEVFEAHHRDKVDAPSGTALALGRVLANARGLDAGDSAVFNRHGHTGSRATDKIGYQSLRGGDTAGEHTVFFLGDGERIELTHRAGDRRIFARGALLAARWLARRPPGLYSMADVLASIEDD